MTAIQLYEAVLIELNKVKAPSMSLSDFVYYFNKATQLYMNQMYNAYEVNQQKVDDLRVIRKTAILTPQRPANDMVSMGFFTNSYEVELPYDYWHILNCIIRFRDFNCGRCDSPIGNDYIYIENKNCPDCSGSEKWIRVEKPYCKEYNQGAKRLTSDSTPHVIHNFYMQPSIRNPYYYINNVQGDAELDQELVITKPKYLIELKNGILSNDPSSLFRATLNISNLSNLQSIYRELLRLKNGFVQSNLNDPELLYIHQIDDYNIEISHPTENLYTQFGLTPSTDYHNFTVEKGSNMRYGNSQKVRMELRFGEDQNIVPVAVYIDYLRAPKQINLTQEELDDYEDNSQILEFPDYVVYEIINILVRLVLEQNSNPARIQTHAAINDSVANPAAQQK